MNQTAKLDRLTQDIMKEKEIKARLAALRKRRKFTQLQLSQKLGISLTAYRDLEKGNTEIINKRFIKACNILGANPREILISENNINQSQEKTYFQLLRELGNWKPQNRHVTSNEEIDKIVNHFGMNEMKIIDLKNLRDMTVSYYSALLEDAERKEYAILAMMSITAIIDTHLLTYSPG